MNAFSKTILPVITLALLVTNGFLIYQNLSLKSQLQAFAPKQIKEGNILAEFEAKDLNGNPVPVNYDTGSAKRVLLYFHPTCGWCKKQMPYWKELVSKVDPAKYRITAITTDENADAIKEYLNNYNANSWTVVSIKKDDADKAELSGTPTTVVLDDKGKVEKVWVGMWRDKELTDAGNYFAVDFNKIEAKMNQ